MKGRKNTRFHTCCGKRIKARMIDGQLVKQPHPCSDASDVSGVDWDKVLQQQKGIA